MRKFLLLFSIYICFCSPLFSKNTEEDNGIVKGTITAIDNKPAAAVTVEIKELRKSTVTDDKGQFIFKNIRPGNYTLEVTSIGYTKIGKEVTGEANSTVDVQFQLTVNEERLSEVLVNSNRKSYIAAKVSPSLRLNADLIEVPQNITVATKQTLTDMGLLTKSEIFRISSSITKSYGTEPDLTFQIRGINSTFGTYRNGVGGPIWWNAQEDASMIERIESSREPDKVNISGSTYELVKDKFTCIYRGKIEAKNKWMVDMYFVEGKTELSRYKRR